jgi:glucose/arabinose dehydrogenase
MRKILITLAVVVLLLAAIPVALVASGTIDSTSLRMMLNVMTGWSGPAADSEVVKQRYQLPPGFSVSLYASDTPRARFLHMTPMGDLLVSRPHMGDILLLQRDADSDGLPDAQRVLVDNLKRPLGLDVHAGWLYIAESHRIIRLPFDDASATITGEREVLVDGLTDNGNHWSKTLRVGPDERLYLAQGSTCNVCEEEDPRRATMMRFQLDGSSGAIIADGLRNSVGFDWAPWNNALYATDNGRDLLGDDFPPCELNRIEAGSFYGWPYFNGANIPDPDMGEQLPADSPPPTEPEHGFRAHNAPLGIRFLDGSGLPPEFQRSALVALHGSWNRSEPDGYKVVSLHWTDGGIEERDFLTGFNLDGDISGRPVDVVQGPDGAFYVSDDYAGAIYKITYGAESSNSVSNQPLAGTKPRSRLDAAPPAWLAEADLAAMAASGAALYEQYNCASCHAAGENPLRLDGLAQRMGYAAVIDALQAPQAPMPIFPLSEDEQRALAVYLLGPGPGKRTTGQAP